jgi:septal ring factor EnvC (AmiA/AmiB activator)
MTIEMERDFAEFEEEVSNPVSQHRVKFGWHPSYDQNQLEQLQETVRKQGTALAAQWVKVNNQAETIGKIQRQLQELTATVAQLTKAPPPVPAKDQESRDGIERLTRTVVGLQTDMREREGFLMARLGYRPGLMPDYSHSTCYCSPTRDMMMRPGGRIY